METEKAKSVIESAAAFKSYYVVWKPYVTSHACIWMNEFKSYYVVWKLLIEDLPNLEEISLNRTM